MSISAKIRMLSIWMKLKLSTMKSPVWRMKQLMNLPMEQANWWGRMRSKLRLKLLTWKTFHINLLETDVKSLRNSYWVVIRMLSGECLCLILSANWILGVLVLLTWMLIMMLINYPTLIYLIFQGDILLLNKSLIRHKESAMAWKTSYPTWAQSRWALPRQSTWTNRNTGQNTSRWTHQQLWVISQWLDLVVIKMSVP